MLWLPLLACGPEIQLGEDAGLTDGRMMVSLREFKKASPVFFCETKPS